MIVSQCEKNLVHSIRQGPREATGCLEAGKVMCDQFTRCPVGCVEGYREVPPVNLRISSHLLRQFETGYHLDIASGAVILF